MTQQERKTMEKATTSEGGPMSELQSLTLRAQDLSRSVDWWNTIMIWTLVVAAIAAAAVVVSTRKSITEAKKLDEVKDRIADIKEEDARTRQQTIDLALAKQQERAAKAEKDLLEVQERIKPRHLTLAQQKELIVELKPFTGQAIDVFVLNDAGDEIGHISEQIVSILKESGWVLKVGNGSETGISRSGIVITPLDNADAGSRKALSALESALRSKGLGVNKPNATTFTGEGHTWRMGTNTTTTA